MSQLFPGSKSGNGADSVPAVAIATQAIAAATRTVITGTVVQIPTDGLKAGSRFTADLIVTKTAAGTAVGTLDIFTVPRDSSPVLANATARVSLAKVAGTADISTARILIDVVVRTVAASGVLYGEMTILNGLGATLGVINVPVSVVAGVSSGFDNSDLAGGYIGVALTTGAADAYTVQQASADLYEPGT